MKSVKPLIEIANRIKPDTEKERILLDIIESILKIHEETLKEFEEVKAELRRFKGQSPRPEITSETSLR